MCTFLPARFRGRRSIAIVCAVLASPFAPIPGAAQINVRGASPAGTNEYSVEPLRTPPSVAWEARPGFRDLGAIAAAGNVVVTVNTTGDGGVYAFSADSGRLLWRVRGPYRSEPTVEPGGVVVVTEVGDDRFRLQRLDLDTGRPLWTVDGAKLGSDAAPLVAGDRVYLASLDGTVSSHELETGRRVWEQRYSPGPGHCPTAISLSDGVLFFGGGERRDPPDAGRFLWALDAATGRELWKYQAMPERTSWGGECLRAPAVAANTVVTAAEHTLFAVDARTGELRWRVDVEGAVDGRQAFRPLSEPVVAGGRVYAYFQEGLLGWALESGSEVVRVAGHFPRYNTLRMAATGGLLYFLGDLEGSNLEGNRATSLYAMDLSTRAILWSHRVDSGSPGWPSGHFLPVDEGIYYENESVLVRLR